MTVPFFSETQTVDLSWIDYNGHMNVAFYTSAFDKAIDEFLDNQIGVGPKYISKYNEGSYALQTQYRYLQELRLNEDFFVEIFIVDFTPKRMHLMSLMNKAEEKVLAATCETILLNVDLKERKSCNYNAKALDKIERLYNLAEQLRSEVDMGHSIGLRN